MGVSLINQPVAEFMKIFPIHFTSCILYFRWHWCKDTIKDDVEPPDGLLGLVLG
jgi:hypothetical protein